MTRAEAGSAEAQKRGAGACDGCALDLRLPRRAPARLGRLQGRRALQQREHVAVGRRDEEGPLRVGGSGRETSSAELGAVGIYPLGGPAEAMRDLSG